MFINAVKKQNPALLEIAKKLLQTGEILPDTYLLDVDQIIANAKLMADAAKQHNLQLYFMTKQLGRNGWLIKQILEATNAGIVTVDFKEAESLLNQGIYVNHLGHLVQVPEKMIEQVLKNKPEVITVYSIEKAESINRIAKQLNRVQPILLKIAEFGDLLYPSQDAGFSLHVLPEVIQSLRALQHIEIVGVTHFPCLQWQANIDETLPTPNLHSLIKSTAILRALGIESHHINAPSAASANTFAILAQFGVTHTEPGHSLTGTMPSNHAGNQPEKIAIVYATEVSHHFAGDSYCFGGGVYRRGNMHNALVYGQSTTAYEHATVLPIDATSIDYHIGLKGEYTIGAPVLLCFRTQIFVTRSDVAMITGLQTGQPQLVGIFDAQGQFKCTSYLERFAEQDKHIGAQHG